MQKPPTHSIQPHNQIQAITDAPRPLWSYSKHSQTLQKASQVFQKTLRVVLTMVPNPLFVSGSRLQLNWIRCNGFYPTQKIEPHWTRCFLGGSTILTTQKFGCNSVIEFWSYHNMIYT